LYLDTAGVDFVLLCRADLSNDVEHLRSESLIGWDQKTEIDGWFEYSGVMVLSDVWSEVRVEHKELVNQLRPRTYMGVALRGGLRDTKSGAWLVGYGPEVVVHAFAKEANVLLIDLSDNREVATFDLSKSGTLVPIEWSQSGDYVIRIQSEGQQYERFVRIAGWSSIQIGSVEEQAALKIGNKRILGAVINAGE
jgi:hypothetical protein